MNMDIISLIAFLIILLSIPILLLHLALYILSNYFLTKLSFEYYGFLKFKNINFYIDTDSYFIYIHIDYFLIFFIWLKLRISIKGIKSTLTLKTNYSSLIKTKPINKYKFADSFIIKKNDTYNKNYGILNEIKDKFNKIILEKYINNFIIELQNENNLDKNDNVNKPIKSSFIKKKQNIKLINLSLEDKLLRYALSFFDLVIDNIEFNFKLSESEFFYRIHLNKVIIYN